MCVAPGVRVADRVLENDRARAALRVEGRFRVLCVTGASERRFYPHLQVNLV